jgi:hypothetical protein
MRYLVIVSWAAKLGSWRSKATDRMNICFSPLDCHKHPDGSVSRRHLAQRFGSQGEPLVLE